MTTCIDRTHTCTPASRETEHTECSTHITERCSCGQVRRSELWPEDKLSLGDWVTPTQ